MVRKLLVAGLLAFLGSLSTPSFGQTNVLLIVDFSGSMKKVVAGKETRMDAAKRVLGDTLRDMPDSVRLGLLAYGHRRAKDCQDIELVSPIGADTPARITERVQGFRPIGETPIAAALQEAMRSFAALQGQSNSIVIVTDGIEECKGDPCAAAKTIAGAGLGLKVDIVGFTLSAADRKAIECVTQATGGTYYDAKDAKALTAALKEVRQQVAQAPPPPPPEFNLLLAANGGTIALAPGPEWASIISGRESDETTYDNLPSELVFSFKDDRPATFAKFQVFIKGQAGGNPESFELLAGDDIAGPFRSLGQFKAQNLRNLRSPYQEFKFDETKASYFKLRLLSSYGQTGYLHRLMPQIRLIGKLEDGAVRTAAQAPALTNLLARGAGGQVLAAPSPDWENVISGNDADEVTYDDLPSEVIFAFKDEKPATFSAFAVLIKGAAGGNPAEFELLAGDDIAGPYRSLGQFKTQNALLARTPYQEFKFPETTAAYLKLRLTASHGQTGFLHRRMPQVRALGKPG